MCDFCVQHGEGKKWYLVMQNYSRELWGQQQRSHFMEDFGAHFEERIGKAVAQIDSVRDIPLVGRIAHQLAVRKAKALHWGQVVPIEDAEQIVDLVDSIVRLPCACRKLTTGREARYCFGLGIDWIGILGRYPDYSHSFDVLEKLETKNVLRSFDKQGLVHSIWTFKTPYIGAICNCDQDCIPFHIQVKTNLLQIMFRAEYVALVDWNLCNGCKKCLLNCQFGAIRYSNAQKRSTIDTTRCYGCGVCRAVCDKDAITLKPRNKFARVL
jgi:Pyruvate/2-oxoacid:ferredoxin oxidoreductase delta subunit